MKKIIAWILSMTKVGKVVEPVQNFISGYKTYIAAFSLMVPALLTMIQKFGDLGTAYLLDITSTPEWALFMNGLAAAGIRAGISKAAK